MFGKWHLGEGRSTADRLRLLERPARPGPLPQPGVHLQGAGRRAVAHGPGYVTDLITDLSLDWLKQRDRDSPSACSATTRRRTAPGSRTRSTRTCTSTRTSRSRRRSTTTTPTAPRPPRPQPCAWASTWTRTDLKCEIAPGPAEHDAAQVGLPALHQGLPARASPASTTTSAACWTTSTPRAWRRTRSSIYTSDQGFFLGDHGWFDKRFMYEESLRMPFIVRYPREIKPGTSTDDMVLNVDFAPLFLDLAGVADPGRFQGRSFRRSSRARRPRTGSSRCTTATGCTWRTTTSTPITASARSATS